MCLIHIDTIYKYLLKYFEYFWYFYKYLWNVLKNVYTFFVYGKATFVYGKHDFVYGKVLLCTEKNTKHSTNVVKIVWKICIFWEKQFVYSVDYMKTKY